MKQNKKYPNRENTPLQDVFSQCFKIPATFPAELTMEMNSPAVHCKIKIEGNSMTFFDYCPEECFYTPRQIYTDFVFLVNACRTIMAVNEKVYAELDSNSRLAVWGTPKRIEDANL